MLIDSHCHIHDREYNFDPQLTLDRAKRSGVEKIIVIGTSPADNQVAHAFATAHQGVYWSYGAHPESLLEDNVLGHWISSVKKADRPSPKNLSERSESFLGLDGELPFLHAQENPRTGTLSSNKLIAVGEIGLDYHYQPYDRAAQIKLFETMLDLASQHHLPVIFHVREAFEDFWPIVDNAGTKNAVLHSFSDTPQNLHAALQRGFYIGVNGLVTFADIPLPPLERMLLETDAPFLTPRPFRGKINEPSYVKNIAEWVAEKLQVPFQTVAQTTTENATKLFNLQG